MGFKYILENSIGYDVAYIGKMYKYEIELRLSSKHSLGKDVDRAGYRLYMEAI